MAKFVLALSYDVERLDEMMRASEAHTRHYEEEIKRLRKLLRPFAQSEVCRLGSRLDTIGIYVRRGDVRDAWKEFEPRD